MYLASVTWHIFWDAEALSAQYLQKTVGDETYDTVHFCRVWCPDHISISVILEHEHDRTLFLWWLGRVIWMTAGSASSLWILGICLVTWNNSMSVFNEIDLSSSNILMPLCTIKSGHLFHLVLVQAHWHSWNVWQWRCCGRRPQGCGSQGCVPYIKTAQWWSWPSGGSCKRSAQTATDRLHWSILGMFFKLGHLSLFNCLVCSNLIKTQISHYMCTFSMLFCGLHFYWNCFLSGTWSTKLMTHFQSKFWFAELRPHFWIAVL